MGSDLVQVERYEEEYRPLDGQHGHHGAHRAARVAAQVRPSQPAGAEPRRLRRVLLVFPPAAVKAPDGPEGDKVLEPVGDGVGVEKVAAVPGSPGDDGHGDDPEGGRDLGGAGGTDQRGPEDGERDRLVDEEEKEDEVDAARSHTQEFGHKGKIRANLRNLPVILARENAKLVSRRQRHDGSEEDEYDGKRGVHEEPEEVVDNPVRGRSQTHHAHHYAKLHLSQDEKHQHIERGGWGYSRRHTSFSYTKDTIIVGNRMLKARVKKNGPRTEPKSKLRKVAILGI